MRSSNVFKQCVQALKKDLGKALVMLRLLNLVPVRPEPHARVERLLGGRGLLRAQVRHGGDGAAARVGEAERGAAVRRDEAPAVIEGVRRVVRRPRLHGRAVGDARAALRRRPLRVEVAAGGAVRAAVGTRVQVAVLAGLEAPANVREEVGGPPDLEGGLAGAALQGGERLAPGRGGARVGG